MIGSTTSGLVSFDGVAAAGAQLFVPGGENRFVAAGATFLAHQVVHNMITSGSANTLNTIDNMLPNFLPLDGVIGTGIAYYLNGPMGAMSFAMLHGPLHGIVTGGKKF